MREARRAGWAATLALSVCVAGGAAHAAAGDVQPAATVAAPASPAWFRVFLTDGRVLSVVGEFTRVDDLVVLQVPVQRPGAGGAGETRAVSVRADAVDWTRTEAYRDALRRAQFERAGGERAYAAFTEEVAATLRDVALLPDPLERIRRLEAARADLARWPAAHHGYRASDVAQTLSVVDDLLNGMRAAVGQQAFTLALTTGPAATPEPAPAPLLPPPTLQDLVAQALGLAPHVADPAERVLLLQSAQALLDDAPDVDRRWARTTRRQIHRQIRREEDVTRRYARLRTWMLGATTRLLAVADVRGLMRVREEIVARDVKLKTQRPAEVASMLATLDTRLDTARRHRLLLERWAERRPALDAYVAAVAPHLEVSAPLPRALEDVKALSGPDASLLSQAEAALLAAASDARRVQTPDEARATQQIWQSAQQLASRALAARRAAVRSGDLDEAWQASAAAAGALMLLQQLRADVPALARPPALPVPTGL